MLHFLYNFWTLEKWYRLSGRSVSSMDMSVLVHVCPNDKLFFVSVRLNIEHSMKLIGRTSNQLLKITNKSINISEIFIEKTFLLTDPKFYRFRAWIFQVKTLTFYREFFQWYFYRSSNEVHVIVSRNSFWVYFFFFPIVWLPRPDPLNQRVKIRVPLNLESSHARPLNVVDWRSDRRSDQIRVVQIFGIDDVYPKSENLYDFKLTHSKFPIFSSPNDTISCRSIKQHFNEKLPELYWTTRCIQSVLDWDH